VRVKDSKVQVVPDNTVVDFVSTSGKFIGASEDTPQTIQAGTTNGVLNVKYIVGSVKGDVKITAASGDKFGSTILHATCPTGVAAGTSAAGGAAAAPCIPIGDNVCITPPNTGSGGLKKR
jgi:hypothetical protein